MRGFVTAAAIAGSLIGGQALANGRYPATNGIHFQPGDPHSLYVATTFGLLISHDDGCTFDWVCEQAIGYGGTFDPKYRVGSDGAIYATTMYGLQASHDGGCSFQTASLSPGSGGSASQYIDAIDLGPGGEVWVGSTDDATTNALYSSRDGGMTFEVRRAMGAEMVRSIVVAPADATRVYATSYETGSGSAAGTFLYRSDDDGSDWQAMPLAANVALGQTPLVEVFAVDPAQKDVVFLSSVGANPPIGDVLYRSTDGGATFAEVLRTTSAIHDVAFADALHVYVSEDPTANDMGTLTPSPAFASTDGGMTFGTLAGGPQLECIGSRGDGTVFGCGQNWDPDHMAVAELMAATWSDVFRFVQMAGPLALSGRHRRAGACGPQWASIQDMFETTGPTCGSDAGSGGGDAGVGGGKPPGGGGGGCDAGAGGPVIGCAMFAALVLLRRRRQ